MTEHIVLIADGKPDNAGDTVKVEEVSWPNDGVPLRFGVGGPDIGVANLRRRGNEVVASFDFDPKLWPPRLTAVDFAGKVPAINGVAERSDDGVYTNLKIQAIGLCENNVDPRVPALPPPDRPQGNQ